MTWPKRDMLAITVDGAVLVNVLAIEEDNPPPLALQRGIFVGVMLTADEQKLLAEHIYDATAEAASIISGRRRRARADRK